MGWDEAIFGYVLKKFGGKSKPENSSHHVLLETEASTLRLFAAALTGESLKIVAAEKLGGADQERLLLPERIDLFANIEDNRKAYLYRLLVAVTVRKLDLALPWESGEASRALSDDEIARVRTRLEAEFPRAGEWLLELVRKLRPALGDSDSAVLANPLATNILFGGLSPRMKIKKLATPVTESFSQESLASGTEIKGKPRERAQEIRLGERKDDENPLVHVFEKVLTADEYGGGKKNIDGSDELEDHEEALRELNLKHVIRSPEKTRSIYKSDAVVDGGAPDLEDASESVAQSFLYDEWDHSKKNYRRDWCTVFKSTATADSTVAPRRPPTALVKRLRAELEKSLNERRWRARQPDGPEPDLDALVIAATDRKSGLTPSNRLFLSRRRTHQDFAATILIDMSLSTDAWVNNHHVIQVARESVLMLAEVLDGIATNVSIAAFSSNTRRDCRFLELKGFNENWGVLRARLPALKPTGYTRIGPAIRHAALELNQRKSKTKLLLLISDGKPTDYDRYEGTYGMEDIRRAIKEAQESGLRVRAIAIDAEAKFSLPRMFGSGKYQILPHPEALAPALSKIFAQCLV